MKARLKRGNRGAAPPPPAPHAPPANSNGVPFAERSWDRFYGVIRRVPKGRVTTYGAVALAAGFPRAARHVGYALAALRGGRHDVPWQRVLAARPRGFAAISIKDPMGAAVQRQLLEAEGVAFDSRERVSLAEFGWPKAAKAKRQA